MTIVKPRKTSTRILNELNTHTPKILGFGFHRVLKTRSFCIGLSTLPHAISLNLKIMNFREVEQWNTIATLRFDYLNSTLRFTCLAHIVLLQDSSPLLYKMNVLIKRFNRVLDGTNTTLSLYSL